MGSHRVAPVAVAGLLLALCPAHAQAQARFDPLAFSGGTPAPPATAVSGNGQVVVGGWGFRWTLAGGIIYATPQATTPGWFTATACSNEGDAIVGTFTDAVGVTYAYLWTLEVPPSPIPPTSAHTEANGISDNRTVAGVYFDLSGDGPTAATWRAATGWHALGPAPSYAYAITPDSTVVVGRSGLVDGDHACIWQNGTRSLIAPADSAAYAVAADGQTVVGAATGHAFRWTASGGFALLENPPRISNAYSVSADGSRIVGTVYTNGTREAFLWDAVGGLRSLRRELVCRHGLGGYLDGWTLQDATGISRDGTVIVGGGVGPYAPYTCGWIAHLPRCPGDYDGDGEVTSADLGLFVGTWFASLAAADGRADFDLNGTVAPADVAAFVRAWLLAISGQC